ncbi:MAG: hypothetical protein QGG36_05115 [Pirellulaceae bacterium]|jgi:hypothetical protein|nr:hypothetical protein [Pirellulaceae bacterium]
MSLVTDGRKLLEHFGVGSSGQAVEPVPEFEPGEAGELLSRQIDVDRELSELDKVEAAATRKRDNALAHYATAVEGVAEHRRDLRLERQRCERARRAILHQSKPSADEIRLNEQATWNHVGAKSRY